MSSPEEPELELTIDGSEPLTLNRYNTTLYTFAGNMAIFDHVFVQTGNTDTEMTGKYLFTQLEAFDTIKRFIETHGLPQVMNMNNVAACDVEAYENQALADIRTTDSFPPEWVTGAE